MNKMLYSNTGVLEGLEVVGFFIFNMIVDRATVEMNKKRREDEEVFAERMMMFLLLVEDLGREDVEVLYLLDEMMGSVATQITIPSSVFFT